MQPHDDMPPARTGEQHALENVRRLLEWNRQDTGLGRGAAVPQKIRTVGVVGAGTMGVSIAAAHAKHDMRVVIADSDHNALAAAPDRIAAELRVAAPESDAQQVVARLVEPTSDMPVVAQCDLVIEAITETFGAKQALYAHLAEALAAKTILASNTSTIPIGRLGSAVSDPTRFCGFHFCHPVEERPLVEVVRGPKTNDATIVTIVAHAKSIGKMPILVHDGPGFLINRLLLPYLSEALDLLLEGATIEAIEQAATEFGMAKGPLRLLDEIGLDTTLQGGLILSDAFPDRIAASPVLVAMIKAGRLGRKSGAGFYGYPAPYQLSGPYAADPAAVGTGSEPMRENARRIASGEVPVPLAPAGQATADQFVRGLIAQWAKTPRQHTAHSITTRLLLPMVLEATRVLEENKVRDPRDVDLATIFGLGFPAWRGGLLWWADTLGAARIVEMLRPLETLGSRLQPTPMLQRLGRTGGRFYMGIPTRGAPRGRKAEGGKKAEGGGRKAEG